MKDFILVIGLGSMGKRRVRNLQALGINNIIGLDIRLDRREETKKEYDIIVVSNYVEAIEKFKISAFIISLPPAIHHIYMKKSIELEIPAFIEASVIDTDFEQIIRQSNEKDICLAPSCTLFFHPAIKQIANIIQNNELGKISNFLYH